MGKQLLKIILFICLIFVSWNSIAQTQTITSPGSGTFVVPDKITTISVQVWGAGGAGGTNSGGGGGAGAYSQMTFTSLPSNFSYSIGQGGTSTTRNGGNTWFSSATTLMAVGGIGGGNNNGNGGAGGLASAGYGTTKTSGGNGANRSGSVGGNGGNSPNGGNGGNGGISGNSGIAGTNPGGGGGGSGNSNNTVPLGGNGQIIITWSCSNTLTSASGTDSQTLCVNNPITNITYEIAGATGATFSGLPAGISGNYSSGNVTISGSPSVSGTFNYTITPTGSCTSNVINGTITVTANQTVGAASSSPTVCIDNSFTNITHSTTDATGITNDGVDGANGLPTGVSATWSGNTITISGTPSVSGTFNYSIPVEGCLSSGVNATGTITVTANQTVGAASSSPTVCIDNSFTNITHSTTDATGITNDGVDGANGLPTGVSATWSGNTITISGTPSISGTFNYSIPVVGCLSSGVNATGTITVTANQTVGAASSSPTVCIDNSFTNITHSTTDATGITNDGLDGANGLPTGVSATWSGNTITISGTPSVSGTFNYSIPVEGCLSSGVNATGTIAVTANQTVGAASSSPTVCIDNSFTNITHSTTDATGITNDGLDGANGLPTGVSATWSGNTITISGTPSVSGTFNYSIPVEGCLSSGVNATGTIAVTANQTVGAASSSPTVCIDNSFTNITHSTTDATGITNDGVDGANGLPTGVSATWSGNTITISGTPSVSGTFNYSIPVEGCLSSGVNATGTIVVNPVATISNMTGGACTDGSFSFVPTNGIDGSIPAGTTYSWSVPTVTGGMTGGVSGSGASDISGTLSNPTNSPQTATYLVTPTSGTCDGPQFTITITVDPITAITTQPDTMGEVECFGDGFSEISVSAIGGDLTYQWYSTSTPINSGGTAVSGATSANFTPPSTTLGSNYYYVVVTGNCGIESSDVSGEYIVTPPVTTVTNHPSTSDQTVCNGGTFSPLSVTAIGEGTVSYQWYSNTSNSNSGGTLITGATSDTYTPPTSTNGTTYYYVVANSDCGTVPTNVSGAFTVTPLTEITLEELDAQAICDGDTFDPISITATGTGTITYQWYSNATNSNSGGTLITGATADTYNPPATAAGTTTFYYVTVSSDCGPNVTSSVSGAFTVNPLPVPTFVTEPTSDICVGTSVTYTTQSGSGEHDYLWTIPGVSGTDYTITSGGIGSSDPTVTVTWLTDGSKDVSVSYTNANNCIATTTADNSLIVNPLPVPTFEVEPTAPVCVGSSVTYTTQSGSGESNYLWTIPGTSGVDYTITSGGNGTSDPTVTLTWLTDGSKDVSVSYTNANNCIATTTANNTLFVNPLPVPTFTTSPGANVCEQSDVTYTTQSGKSDYIWNIPGTEGTDYTITSGGTSSDETVILQWLTTGSQTVEVSYTEPSTGCIATSAASSTTDVEPFATVGATSVAFPSVCSNNPTLTPFTQPTTGVTGIGTPTGLPAGVTATFNSSTGNIEFSGNVSGAATGLYTYSIPLTGNCINGLEATGTIDVTPDYEITAISSVSATSIGGSATVTFYGDPAEMLNGTYELYYQIKQGGGSFSSPIAVTATVNNGKGTFSTTAINSNVDTYTVQLLSIKKSTDVCNIILTSLPTTYFGVCSAVFTSGTNTFYVPANVYSITIEVYGGGGGGDNGGAGGGAYSIRTNVPVTPGEPLAVITGAGGARNGNNNGGVSYVTRDSNIADQLANSLVYANGGNSGSNSNANKGVGGTFDTRYSGYNGSTVTGNPGGAGGGPLGGAGGANGGDGYSPGGGGGKASGQGGDGGSGLVVISYSCPDADNTDCVTVIDDGSKSGYTVLEYTCDDTWTAPEGLSEFTVYVGSGGGGGGSGEGSGGGGSGALIVQTFTTTNPYGLPAGTDFGIIVGAGGPGAGVGERPGTNGEASEFTGEIDGNSIDILVAGGGGGGSQLVNAGGHGSSGGGGGATPAPNKSFGAGGNAIPLTYTGTPDAVYNGNPGGNGDYNDPQNAIAGGGGGGLVPWKLPPANDGQNGKAAGAGQGEGGRGGDAINLALGDSLRYFGAGGGGIGEYFNGTEKIGEGGSSLLDGTKLGGDGNLDILNTSGIGYSGVNKTGSGGGAGYNGGGKGGDGVIYIVFTNFSILEVEYLYFEASYLESDRSGKLKWATSQEWENSHFEIERSINNVKNWEKIGEVEGAGYSSEAIEYEFIDKNLPVNGGMIYYRLKQVDFEGDFTYSVTRSIQANPKNGSGYWVAYPNPSGRTEYVNLSLLNPSVYQDEPIIVRISDFKGVSESYTVHSPEDVSNTVNYHLRNSDHGLFIIQLLWGKHEQQIKIIRK